MNETKVTVVGTVLTEPESRRTNTSGRIVASFKVIANRRRPNPETGIWEDRGHFRVKVNCWGRLGESVLACVKVGDPIILYGRIETNDWKNEQGDARMAYAVDVEALGHDLTRGRSAFTRRRGDALTVEDQDDTGPESLEPHDQEVAFDPDFVAGTDGVLDGPAADAVAILRGAGLGPDYADAGGEDDTDEDEIAGADAGSGGSGGRGRRRGRQPVPA